MSKNEIKSTVLLPEGSKETIATKRNGEIVSQGIEILDDADLKIDPLKSGRGEETKTNDRGEVVARIFDRPAKGATTAHLLHKKLTLEEIRSGEGKSGKGPAI